MIKAFINLFLFLILFAHNNSFAQEYPNYSSVFINDFANVLDPEQEERITQLLATAKSTRDTEITLVTINSQANYGFSKNIEEFATGLFNTWGIGDAERNDGILILVAVQDREMRIELGSGYPRRFDKEAKAIIDNYFLPAFKQGDYAAGIEAGTKETIERINLAASGQESGMISSLMGSVKSLSQASLDNGITPWIAGIISSLLGLFGFKRYSRNKPRNCQICDREMQRLTELVEDSHLNRGQLVEESVRSKDYDVWHCIVDNSVIIEGYRNWFSRYKVCKHCNYRTVYANRTVINSATESSTGTAKIDYDCKNCKQEWFETVTIAKKSSSSSSSSSSSFSGGSSSGGGASGSW